jgi:SP family arabinose:H+ symporter-like MFS transporter
LFPKYNLEILDKSEKLLKSYSYIIRISAIVALGGFLMGFDASVISGVIRFIEPEFGLSELELGWAVSSLTITATLAMMLVGPLSDQIGRRKVLTYAAALYGLSAILSALAPNFVFLVVARMIGGFGVGASLIIAPMYIAETSPPAMRGRLVSFNQLNIVVGISAAFFTNYLILKWGQSNSEWSKTLLLGEYQWRWMLGLETLPAIFYFIALFFVPRSPRWLIMKNLEEEALAVLSKSVGKEMAVSNITEINNSIQEDATKPKRKWSDLFKPLLKQVLLIGIVIGILQQITGINSVFFYAPMIFEQSGIGTDAAFTQAIYVGLANLLFTVVAIAMIDKIGRKPLLIFGFIGIAASMFVLTWGFSQATYQFDSYNPKNEIFLEQNNDLNNLDKTIFHSKKEFLNAIESYLPKEYIEENRSVLISNSLNLNSMLILWAILSFVASFAVSIGPVMWVLFSELFPNTIRAVAISFVGFINSMVSFFVQLVFPWELEFIGNAGTFFIYGIFAVFGLVFVLAKVPETKGKSLEELEKHLIK